MPGTVLCKSRALVVSEVLQEFVGRFDDNAIMAATLTLNSSLSTLPFSFVASYGRSGFFMLMPRPLFGSEMSFDQAASCAVIQRFKREMTNIGTESL
jgi:hypothetical protein